MTSKNKDLSLADRYRQYIGAILAHDLDAMQEYVSEDVMHNNKRLGLEGYKSLLQQNIVDTNVDIEIKCLVVDDSHVAAILIFTTRETTKELVGYKLDGEIFSYPENVFYDFEDGKITNVHSLFDIDVVRSHARK